MRRAFATAGLLYGLALISLAGCAGPAFVVSSEEDGDGGVADAGDAGDAGIPCVPDREFYGVQSGEFGTTDPICLRTCNQSISGWGCSNAQGRVFVINNVAAECGQWPDVRPIGGCYYFDVSAGDFAYASFTVWH